MCRDGPEEEVVVLVLLVLLRGGRRAIKGLLLCMSRLIPRRNECILGLMRSNESKWEP